MKNKPRDNPSRHGHIPRMERGIAKHTRSDNIATSAKQRRNVHSLIVPLSEMAFGRPECNALPVDEQSVPRVCRDMDNTLRWGRLDCESLAELYKARDVVLLVPVGRPDPVGVLTPVAAHFVFAATPRRWLKAICI